MILQRFNTVLFIGDEVAQSVYAAFNILLREDLALGGLQSWNTNEQDKAGCKCNGQFLGTYCVGYTLSSSEDVKKNEVDDRRKGISYCTSKSTGLFQTAQMLRGCAGSIHAYLPINTIPAPESAQSSFKDYAYFKPNPWQPSPVIISLGFAASFDITETTRALDELLSLASGAQRNIPVLYLGPQALGSVGDASRSVRDDDTALWHYSEKMANVVKQRKVDMLGLYNLTLQATSIEGVYFEEKVALVEAMMVINWLSKLETS
jgi:hypothetical protein